MRYIHIILPILIILFLPLTIFYNSYLDRYWGIISLLFLLLLILEFFLLFEERITGSKEVAVISILGAISAASRIPFASIPSVQPSTFIIMLTGYVFGIYAGFMVGIETALLSNFFLGQGAWTPWQMLAWGIAGIIGYAMRGIPKKNYWIYIFMIIGFFYGYIYGIITNLWYWLAFIYPHNIQSFLLVESLSLWFDTLHGLGNVIFMDLFGEGFIKILRRYQMRFSLFL